MALILPLDAAPYQMTAATHPEAFGPDGMTLEAMQAIVGGYIKHVYLPTKPSAVLVEVFEGEPPHLVLTNAPGGLRYAHLVINEEGKLDGLPANPPATINCLAIQAIAQDDWIAGPAILLTDEELQ